MTCRGELYYPSGALYFSGTYEDNPRRLIAGTVYYENGGKKCEGAFQPAGLLCGRLYYPGGQLKWFGRCNDKRAEHGCYYGPSYPVYGYFYGKDGALLFHGQTTVRHVGGIGWPQVVEPSAYGKIDWH